MTGAPTWDEVDGYELPPNLPQGVILAATRRIGDTSATGGSDVLFVGELGVEGANAEWGNARVDDVDGRPVIRIRSGTGEYEAEPISKGGDFFAPEGDMARTIHALNSTIGVMAILRRRPAIIRDTAVKVPTLASAFQRATAAGYTVDVRADALAQRVRVKKNPSGELQEVSLTAAPGTRSAGLLLRRSGGPFLPGIRATPKRELALAIGEELGRVLSARGYQAAMAGIALIYRSRSIELEDGRIPDAFRLMVMQLMGMPSRTASKDQRETVTEALQLLADVEVMVKPTKGKAKWMPILTRDSFTNAPSGARTPGIVRLNLTLMQELDNGRCWRVPEALLQVPDQADRTGIVRMMGFQLSHRLAMGTGGHERLELLIRRAGMEEWVSHEAGKRGPSHVLATLREALATLRALPWSSGPADIVGGTVIEGDTLADAVIEYRNPPDWVRSRARHDMTDMTRHEARHDTGRSVGHVEPFHSDRPAVGI